MRIARAGLLGIAVVLAVARPGMAQPIELVTHHNGGSLNNPVLVTNAGDGSGDLYAVEQQGVILRLRAASQPVPPAPSIFLDIQNLVAAGGERGLLGLAFHPDFPQVPYFFVNYTCEVNAAQPECTTNGDTIIARFRLNSGLTTVDLASRRPLLVIPQPFSNHNAGDLKFCPDGYLWIPMGDGGSANDPNCFAQRDDSLLGKLLRIDVNQSVNTPPYYGIPPDNPYVGAGDPRDEVYARGLRNPFRFSFDRQTGDIFIGDVGQGAREEIDFHAVGTGAAANYGWKVMEGSLCTGLTGGCPGDVPACNAPSLTLPIIEVNHSSGDCAIIGGYRYRGTAMPGQTGRYFHSDNCTGRIRAATSTGPGTWSDSVLLDTSFSISSFGEDEAGELYVTALGASGSVQRIREAIVGNSLSIVGSSVGEGNAGSTLLSFQVRLATSPPQPVTVQYATMDGSATAGSDYVATSGTLTLTSTFPETISVAVLGDALDEYGESFFVNLSNPVNAAIDVGRGVGGIGDDDALPALAASGCSATEGNAGSTPCTFTVTLTPASGRTVTVDYATADGSATAGADYTAAAGIVTFPPGVTQRTVSVDVLADVAPEGNESFSLALTAPFNATGGGAATGTIVEDDLRDNELTHGMTLTADLTAPGPVLFRIGQAPFSSYEVVLDAVSGDAVPGLTLDRVGPDSTTVLTSSVPVGTGSARSLRWQNTTSTAVTTEQIRVAAPACGTACGTDDVYRLRTYETTGAIPRFNNNGSQSTGVVLQNAGASAVQGRLYFWSAQGSLLFSSPFALAAKGTHVLATFNVPELQGQSGSITVASDAAYGALTGKAVSVEPASGLSFDAPMILRSR